MNKFQVFAPFSTLFNCRKISTDHYDSESRSGSKLKKNYVSLTAKSLNNYHGPSDSESWRYGRAALLVPTLARMPPLPVPSHDPSGYGGTAAAAQRLPVSSFKEKCKCRCREPHAQGPIASGPISTGCQGEADPPREPGRNSGPRPGQLILTLQFHETAQSRVY